MRRLPRLEEAEVEGADWPGMERGLAAMHAGSACPAQATPHFMLIALLSSGGWPLGFLWPGLDSPLADDAE